MTRFHVLSLVSMGLAAMTSGASSGQPTAPDRAAPIDMTWEAAEALYRARFDRNARRDPGMGLDSYDTLAPLRGTEHWKPLPQAGRLPDKALLEALAKARAYAAANNSSAFMVWHEGKLVEQSFFGNTREATPIVAKSLAKPLAVIAVGRAIAAGRIASLDQPMADFIPEWRATSKAAITIRQVLSMRSGLLPQGAAPGVDDVLNRAYLHPYHDRVIVNDYPLVTVPGERYDYSNANGDLAAPLIEAATGQPYEDWLAREVLAPLGARGGQIWMNRPGGTPHAGCCALVPAESYLRLAILLLQDGIWEGRRLLPEGYVAQMRTTTPQNPHSGLGLYVGRPFVARRGAGNPENATGATLHSEPYAAEDLFLFDGNSNQVVYIVPSKKLVILRTGDKPASSPEWDNARLPNLLLRAMARH